MGKAAMIADLSNIRMSVVNDCCRLSRKGFPPPGSISWRLGKDGWIEHQYSDNLI